MPLLQRSTLPNAITVGRILLTPGVFFLTLVPGFTPRLGALLLFIIAAVSDLWDGYLARKHGWISDFGKLVDPLADKLLLAATVVPIYMLSHAPDPSGVGTLPIWDALPFWILLVIFGREALITAVRAVAAHQGLVIPAGQSGKYKAVLQNLFVGSALTWYVLDSLARPGEWEGVAWSVWQGFHAAVLWISLGVALLLTLYSMGVYLWKWGTLMRMER